MHSCNSCTGAVVLCGGLWWILLSNFLSSFLLHLHSDGVFPEEKFCCCLPPGTILRSTQVLTVKYEVRSTEVLLIFHYTHTLFTLATVTVPKQSNSGRSYEKQRWLYQPVSMHIDTKDRVIQISLVFRYFVSPNSGCTDRKPVGMN